MSEGNVEAIYIAPLKGGRMEAREEIEALAAKGLHGDRYFQVAGGFPDVPMAPSEVTLIEAEAVEAFQHESGADFGAGDSRRNLVTRGVALNDLVGREFEVGNVRLLGIRLCEPCASLARMTTEAVLPGLVHRGGLRAHILQDGVIHKGDPVRAAVLEHS